MNDENDFGQPSSLMVVKQTLYHQPANRSPNSVTSTYTYECAEGDMYQRTFSVDKTPQPIDKDGRSWVEGNHGMIVIENTGDADLEMGGWLIYRGQSFHGQPIQLDALKINAVNGKGEYTFTVFPEG